MSDAFIGADVTQLEGMATRLETEHALAIDNVLKAVNTMIADLPNVWRGSDATQFASEWDGTHQPMLLNAAEALRTAAGAAKRNAAAQTTTSQNMS